MFDKGIDMTVFRSSRTDCDLDPSVTTFMTTTNLTMAILYQVKSLLGHAHHGKTQTRFLCPLWFGSLPRDPESGDFKEVLLNYNERPCSCSLLCAAFLGTVDQQAPSRRFEGPTLRLMIKSPFPFGIFPCHVLLCAHVDARLWMDPDGRDGSRNNRILCVGRW